MDFRLRTTTKIRPSLHSETRLQALSPHQLFQKICWVNPITSSCVWENTVHTGLLLTWRWEVTRMHMGTKTLCPLTLQCLVFFQEIPVGSQKCLEVPINFTTSLASYNALQHLCGSVNNLSSCTSCQKKNFYFYFYFLCIYFYVFIFIFMYLFIYFGFSAA